MTEGVQVRQSAATLLSSAGRVAAGAERELRIDQYGNIGAIALLTGRQAACLAGNYFTFTETTVGTHIATTTSITALDVTKPVLVVHNNGSANIVMDMVKFCVEQVPTSATSWQFWIKTYNGNARASAGTALTPTNANGNVANTTGAVVYFGAPVAAETGLTVRNHCSGNFRGIIPTTFDSFSLEFGGDAASGMALLTTGSAKYNENVPPLVLAPGHSLSLGMFGASNAAAPTFKVTGGYFEF